IAGYSLTDTVVVFDRIRENMKVRHKEPLETVMNASINEVLPRTVITSLTTLCAALALLIFERSYPLPPAFMNKLHPFFHNKPVFTCARNNICHCADCCKV
ncbi:preprotein translocase subunit SecF, partial [Candidatus Hakubella thermalkaliphila]